MVWSPSKVQLPVRVLERTRQHCGRCIELNHHLPQSGCSEVCSGWINSGNHSQGRDPAVVESDQGIEKEVCITAGWMLVQMHVTDWTEAQKEDAVLNDILTWLEGQKETDLKALLGEHASNEEGCLIWWNHQNFTVIKGPVPMFNA